MNTTKQLSNPDEVTKMPNGISRFAYTTLALTLLLTVGVTTGCGTAAAKTRASSTSSESAVVNQTYAFLNSRDIGTEVVGYVHMGAQYNGHEYLKTMGVSDGQGGSKPGHFALVYRFRWEEDGTSDIAFLCGPGGRVYGIRVVSTNAQLNQPFLLANISIQILGNVLLETYKDKLDDDERRTVKRFVDQADAQGMLTWVLGFQQAVS